MWRIAFWLSAASIIGLAIIIIGPFSFEALNPRRPKIELPFDVQLTPTTLVTAEETSLHFQISGELTGKTIVA
jgi:hypothetical protein